MCNPYSVPCILCVAPQIFFWPNITWKALKLRYFGISIGDLVLIFQHRTMTPTSHRPHQIWEKVEGKVFLAKFLPKHNRLNFNCILSCVLIVEETYIIFRLKKWSKWYKRTIKSSDWRNKGCQFSSNLRIRWSHIIFMMKHFIVLRFL